MNLPAGWNGQNFRYRGGYSPDGRGPNFSTSMNCKRSSMNLPKNIHEGKTPASKSGQKSKTYFFSMNLRARWSKT